MHKIQMLKNKQIPVFIDIGSLNKPIDINVKIIVPIAKPISLEGQSCPPKCSTIH